MNFSRESEYAVRGMLALAGAPQPGALTLQEIAAQDNLPAGFLSKIFQKDGDHSVKAHGIEEPSHYRHNRKAFQELLRAELLEGMQNVIQVFGRQGA